MDVTHWEVEPTTDGLWIELFLDDEGPGRALITEWSARALATAILNELDWRERTRRDDDRRMLLGVYSNQVWCEPCYLEVDVAGTPAITRPYEGDLECCICRFRRRNGDSEIESRPVGVDQGADTE